MNGFRDSGKENFWVYLTGATGLLREPEALWAKAAPRDAPPGTPVPPPPTFLGLSQVASPLLFEGSLL